MKLRAITLENFMSYAGRERVELGELNIVVGPNGSGKTNIIRALKLVGRLLALQREQDIQAYAHNPDKPFTVEVELELSEDEKKAFREWLGIALIWNYNLSIQALKNIRVVGVSPPTLQDFSEFLAAHLDKVVDEPLLVQSVTLTTTLSPIYPWSLAFRVSCGGQVYEYDQATQSLRGQGSTGLELGGVLMAKLSELGYYPPKQQGALQPIGLPKVLGEALANAQQLRMPSVQPYILGQPDTLRVRQSEWYTHFTHFLSQRGWGSPEITFNDLFTLVYNTSLVVLDQWRGRPPGQVTLEEEVVKQGGGIEAQAKRAIEQVPHPQVFDLESAAHTLFELSNSASAEKRGRFRRIAEKMNRITGLSPVIVIERTEKSMPKVTTVLRPLREEEAPQEVHTVSVQAINEEFERRRLYAYRLAFEREFDGRTLSLEQVAAGDIETLLILTALEGGSGRVVLLDEPGQSLHPARQRLLLDEFRCSASDNQLVVVTHSPHFVGADMLGETIRVTLDGKGSRIHKLEALPSEREKKTVEKNDAFIQALFSRLAIVCEGETEYWVAQISLPKALGVNALAELEIVPIIAESDTSINKSCAILEKLGVEYLVLCDEKALGSDAAPAESTKNTGRSVSLYPIRIRCSI